MISVKNVTKKYGDFTAVESISFEVGDGSIYGLVGYNGAGKTTLLKTAAGVYRADAGQVLFDGKETFESPEVRNRLFYVPDEIWFEPFSTIEKMAQFYAGYYPDFNFGTLDKLCEVLKLNKKDKLNSFSKGMQRQAEMILGMATTPKYLLLDESFDGLDPAKRNIMNSMIVDYVAEKNCSVIISSHNLHEISDICDHVALINGKQIALDCSVDDISADRCKFRLVFADEKTEDDFSGFDIKKFRSDGKILTVSLKGDADENEEKLREMNPLLLEKFPLTLEEIFLEEMEGSDYDFKEIFA
ncbi:MAG: ABC transporter ATP-binding protein [Clostridia bacterium]|nr:ABC transporter ATP-binding protein [Clostridia bacterium]